MFQKSQMHLLLNKLVFGTDFYINFCSQFVCAEICIYLK